MKLRLSHSIIHSLSYQFLYCLWLCRWCFCTWR